MTHRIIKVVVPELAGSRRRVRTILSDAGPIEAKDRVEVDFRDNLAVAPGFLQGLVEQLLGAKATTPAAALTTVGLRPSDAELLRYIAVQHDVSDRVTIFT